MAVVLAALSGRGEEKGAGGESWRRALAEEAVGRAGVAALPGMAGEAEARLHLLGQLGQAAPVQAGARRTGDVRLRAAGGNGEVWSLETQEGEATFEAGMWRRGGNWQPLYFCAEGLPERAGATFEDAWTRAKEVVLRGKTAGLEVSGVRAPAVRGRVSLGTWGGREVAAPWDAAWVFQIDDAPLANWAHPCRYVFVAADLSAVAVQQARTPLEIRREGARSEAGAVMAANGLEVLVPFDRTRPAGARMVPRPARGEAKIRYDGSVSNCYAVILSGGFDRDNNHVRYWGDAAFIYSTLTKKYGYPKGNIYALVSDGLDPAVDNSDKADSPKDLDGDGFFDTFGSATAVNVSNLFLNLQASLKATDQLFVFLTDHGSPTTGGGEWEVELNLWNLEVLKDSDLKALTVPIRCPVFFAMEQCHSGGFVDDLGQFNRAVATAARHNESSYAGDTFPEFNQWAYHFTAALRGFYPQTNAPWLDAEACDGDLNVDGYVSFQEAAEYARIHKYESDHPTYGENPSGLGKRMFPVVPPREELGMGELAIDPVAEVLVVNSGFPMRVAAQNVFGDRMSGYAGPVELRTEAAPIDPGEYVGSGAQVWDYPLYTYYMDARTQVIYPPETMGRGRTLDHAELYVQQAPAHSLSNWTMRLKHTALRAYPEEPEWESEGWTVVLQTNVAIAATGWVTMVFQQPFDYDGTNSLMVDFSFNNDGYAANGECRASPAEAMVAAVYPSDNGHGDPLEWAGRVPPATAVAMYPNLRFGPLPIPVEVPVVPSNLTGFVDGEWNGSVVLQQTNESVRLLAGDAEQAGWGTATGRFAVRDYVLELVGWLREEEGGPLRLVWSSFAGRTYRVVRAMSLPGAFEEVAAGIPADPPQNVFTPPEGENPRGFFRVEEEPVSGDRAQPINVGSGGSR